VLAIDRGGLQRVIGSGCLLGAMSAAQIAGLEVVVAWVAGGAVG
jgi:hydroxyethylthiazole kinase-like sugar kinase family protein